MFEKRIAYAVEVAFIVMFMTAIWLPNIDSIFGIAPEWAATEEKRQLQKLPPLRADWQSIVAFQRQFMKYFVDNFGFRGLLIRWNTIFKLDVLKVKQFPKVLVGEEGWLYLIKDDEGNNALDYYRNVSLFADEEDIARWASPILQLDSYCERRGIRLLLVFVPMKPRIYPEYIPSSYRPVRSESRLDQMRDYLSRKTKVRFIDLGESLIAAKPVRNVYYRLDVHWNLFGSYCGYRAIAEKLQETLPGFRFIPESSYTFKEVPTAEGDLVTMLGVKGRYRDVAYLAEPLFVPKARRVVPSYTFKGSRFTDCYETGDTALPRLVVFHDSFFNNCKFYFAEGASRMTCYQSYGRIDREAIEREKPDAVILQIAESFLLKSPAFCTFIEGH